MIPFKELTFINNLLSQNHITYWLDFGCLLKWHRDKKLDESDIDFGIFFKDYDALKSILETNKQSFDMIHYRNKEISIKLNGIKFDFICFIQKNEDLYFYAYKQNPYCFNKWNYEWRGKFPYSVYFPLKTMSINEITVPVPNNIEKKLALQYGEDWQIPKPDIVCWTYELNRVKDTTYNPVAIVMTTFLRDDILFKTLPSYLQYPVKLYLLDQGHHTEEKDRYYNELRNQGHFIEYSDFDIGLSAARNYLLKHVEEEYVLMTEDDIELKTNPYCFFTLFNNNNLGILGGLLIRNNKEQHYEYELNLENKTLTYKKSNKIDLCLNFFLAKRKVFDDILYDEDLKLAEHTAFFLKLKELNKWTVDYTSKFQGLHHVLNQPNYQPYRNRASQVYTDLMYKKFNIEKVIKENKIIYDSKDLSEKLTVFVISCGNNPNYLNCINALNNQTVKFKLQIIKNVAPMSAAFQKMLDTCTTDFYIQCDEDMILNTNAVALLYNSLLNTAPTNVISCFKLFDPHLQKNIDGIKIYRHTILKNYPYHNILGCEMDQITRFQKDGYDLIRNNFSIGIHSPQWTISGIFERYYNYIEKYKKQNKNSEQITLLEKLLTIYQTSRQKTDLYALLGGLFSYISQTFRSDEKNYLAPIIQSFPNLETVFDNIKFPKADLTPISPQKIKVLQITGIPCAGRPWEINNLINTYSNKYESHHILGCQYSTTHSDIPYREFPYEYIVTKDLPKILELIEQAEIIHIHHKLPQKLVSAIKNKKIIFTVSNLSNSLTNHNTPENQKYNDFIKSLTTIITTTNEPFQQKAYSYLTNIHLPLVKCYFKTTEPIKNQIPKICYAPTNRRGNDITSKGYYRILGIIYKLKYVDNLTFDFDLIEGLPYIENLERKKQADILIDDVIQETYHNSSLEAICFGVIPFTNYYNKNYPFIQVNIETLENKLKEYITDKNKLYNEKINIINWKNDNYTPEKLLTPYENLYDTALLSSTIPEITIPITPPSRVQSPTDDLLSLINTGIKFCLLEHSCAEAIKYGEIKSSPCIGVFDSESKNLLNKLCKNIKITTTNTKKITVSNHLVHVPSPVIPYLRKIYGQHWDKNV